MRHSVLQRSCRLGYAQNERNLYDMMDRMMTAVERAFKMGTSHSEVHRRHNGARMSFERCISCHFNVTLSGGAMCPEEMLCEFSGAGYRLVLNVGVVRQKIISVAFRFNRPL